MTTYSSIYIEGGGIPSPSAIFENNNDPIDQSPLLGDTIEIEDENDYENEGPLGPQHGFASYYSCSVCHDHIMEGETS